LLQNVVDRAKGVLCFTVLLRGAGTQHVEDCTLGENMRGKVWLNSHPLSHCMRAHKQTKFKRATKSARLKPKQKDPNIREKS